MCSRESYNHVSSWLADARSLANPDIVIILVGNKKDKDKEREVTFLEASRFSQENGVCVCGAAHSFARSFGRSLTMLQLCATTDVMFLESSARTGEGVEEVFLKCARTILSKIDSGTLTVYCWPLRHSHTRSTHTRHRE